jgi:uncharacterized protein (DUF362 family)
MTVYSSKINGHNVDDYSAFLSENSENVDAPLQEGLNYINWNNIVKKDSVVFVKPNFTFPTYMKGVTTRPSLLKKLLGLLKNRCDRLIVGESNGGMNSFSADEAFEGHKMHEICKETGSELVNLSEMPARYIDSNIQGKNVKVQLPSLLLDEVDCLISVPVLKVHVMTGVSIGMKNLWGCYPDPMRGLHHQNFGEKITLISKILKPKMVVVDALYALNEHGPMWGEPVKTDMLLISDNVVASDSLGASIMGIPLNKANHILVAEKEGLGTTNLDKIRLNVDWKKYKLDFQLRKTLVDHASGLLFKSDLLTKLVVDSPLSPLMYGIAGLLRTDEEKEFADSLKKE